MAYAALQRVDDPDEPSWMGRNNHLAPQEETYGQTRENLVY